MPGVRELGGRLLAQTAVMAGSPSHRWMLALNALSALGEHIDRTGINHAMLLDLFFYTDPSAGEFTDKEGGIERCLWRQNTRALHVPLCQQLGTYRCRNTCHLRRGLPPPITHAWMARAIAAPGRPTSTPALHLNIQQEGPVANILPVAVRCYLEQVRSQKFLRPYRRTTHLDSITRDKAIAQEEPQCLHNLRRPGATHIYSPEALANETRQGVRFGMGNKVHLLRADWRQEGDHTRAIEGLDFHEPTILVVKA